MASDNRKRNFATVVYPDSAPADWLDKLLDLKIPCFVSPLHDADINNGSGEPKKPHYHVMWMYEGKKTDDQAMEVVNLIGGTGLEYVQSLRGYARYLCHLDNPEKAQYAIDKVRSFGGADYIAVACVEMDKYNVIHDIMEFVDNNQIYSYRQLMQWSYDNNFSWFRCLCDNGTYVIKEYLKSALWDDKQS